MFGLLATFTISTTHNVCILARHPLCLAARIEARKLQHADPIFVFRAFGKIPSHLLPTALTRPSHTENGHNSVRPSGGNQVKAF